MNEATAAAAPAKKKKESNSRPARWQRACDAARTAFGKLEDAAGEMESALDELRGIKDEFESWKDSLPEGLANSALGEKLETIVGIDLDVSPDLDSVSSAIEEAEAADLPLGFGRD